MTNRQTNRILFIIIVILLILVVYLFFELRMAALQEIQQTPVPVSATLLLNNNHYKK